MPVHELFEDVTPQLLAEEVAAEIGAELIAEGLDDEVTPLLLHEIGVKAIESVEIGRGDFSRIQQYTKKDLGLKTEGTRADPPASLKST